MSQSQRHRRLRRLLKSLNKQRKRQAAQIDILCNDLIGAQRSVLQRLTDVSFAGRFYKSLLGISDLKSLLSHASEVLTEEVTDAGITFFLRQPEGCEIHVFDPSRTVSIDGQRLEDCFSTELVDRICKSNKPCLVNDMFGMGLEGNLSQLDEVSMVTLPLNDLGRSLGFLLLYRPASHPLTAGELHKMSLITCGLSRAIRGSNVPVVAHL